MKLTKIFGTVLLVFAGALIAVFVYARFLRPEPAVIQVPQAEQRMRYVNLPGEGEGAAPDFTGAVEQSIHAVVHVKTKMFREYAANPLYEFFFGEQPQQQPAPILGFGSGVILTRDGYIVTNNHVIEGSDEVAVVLNDKREFTAEVIGADPTTDIALLKVDGSNLSSLPFGNSEALRLGEWVLAIGNPYNLTSTVTAGIVSAKARSINILQSEFGIESFIQTDAAVNPGNSGGALINTRGELVGINTAIASRTGTFTGYSFAVPSSIVQKVVNDLMEFGTVQRAILGVTVQEVTAELAKEKGIEKIEGVFVTSTRADGAAREVGIRDGDIILSVNDAPVNSGAQLQEHVSRYRPGEKVKVVVRRDGKLKQFDVVLRNLEGSTDLVQKNNVLDVLGARFEALNDKEKRSLGIAHGIRVSQVSEGKFMKVGIREGFILTTVNKRPVDSVTDISEILDDAQGGVIIEGIDHRGARAYYAFGM
ncbi:MAG: Do family serine endopeptidase [Bacteroidales bacterium]